jgi:hypothetical protein
MKKYHLALILLTGLVCAPAKGDMLFTTTLDSPVQSGSPGDFLQFFGTITNNDTTLSDPAVYLNSDNFSLTGFNYATDVTDDFANTPISLGPGASSGDIELFDITIPNPFTDPCIASVTCGGTYQIFGGADGGAGTADDLLGTANFTVDVQEPSGVPEPSSAVLLSSALLLLLVARKIVARPVR